MWLRAVAKVEGLFDAEQLENLVLATDGGERLVNERLWISGLGLKGGGEEERDEGEKKTMVHGGGGAGTAYEPQAMKLSAGMADETDSNFSPTGGMAEHSP